MFRCFALCLLIFTGPLFILGCGNTREQNPQVTVSVSPKTVELVVSTAQQFTATVSGALETAIEWHATDGTISGEGNTITYTAPSTAGTYELTASSVTFDAKDTATITVIVPNQPPTASFTASPENGEAPLTVVFDASDSSDPDGSIVAYAWDFGDEQSGSGATVEHTYTEPGDYTVTLTVMDDEGITESTSTTIEVFHPFSFSICDPGDNRDYESSCGVKFVERGGKRGYLVLEVSSSDMPATTAHLEIESTPPEGITYSWTSQDVSVGEGAGSISYAVYIEASPDVPVGPYTLQARATIGSVTESAEGTYEVVEAPTEVGGIISADTTWRLEDSPYRITSQVQIDYGATLTIEPGVVVEDGSIKVWGSLQALGTKDNLIELRNVEIIGGTSNYGQPYVMDFRYVQFFNTPFLAPTGYSTYGTFSLRDSVIHSGFDYTYIWYPTSDVFIERNVFLNEPFFSIGHRNPVNILNNAFVFGGEIENWAAYEGPTIVRHNSFLDNGFRVGLEQGYDNADIDARENYWGTTDTSTIEEMIVDRNDGLDYADFIPYEPYLSEPHPATPDPSPYLY